MGDSDDYFDDSLILDDSALAILQQAEEEYASKESTRTSATPAHTTAKVLQNHKAGLSNVAPLGKIRNYSSNSSQDVDELPDIVLQDDGSYVIQAHGVASHQDRKSATHVHISNNFDKARVTHNTGNVTSVSHGNIYRQPPQATKPVPSKSATLHGASNLQSNSQRPQHSQAVRNAPQSASSRPRSVPKVAQAKPASQSPISSQPAKTTSKSDLEKELESLRALLEESNRAKLSAEQSFKDAENARYAKEGEVTMLRKKLEQEAKERAADIARLKSTVADAEAAKVKMQKDIKEEMEKLRTQFIFKQHEIESNTRRPGTVSSSRPKRSLNNVPITPVPVPPAMRTWGTQAFRNAEDSVERSPKRRKGNVEVPMRTQRTGNATFREPALPGYENTFLSSPAKTPVPRLRKASEKNKAITDDTEPVLDTRNKGKGKEISPTPVAARRTNMEEPRSSPSPARNDFSSDADFTNPSPWKSAGRSSSPFDDMGSASFGIDLDLLDNDNRQSDEPDNFVGIDWKDIIRSMLFSHSTSYCSSTIQSVISSLSPDSDAKLITMHRDACAEILEYVGARYSVAELEVFEERLAEALLSLIYVFKTIRDLKVLVSLMDLLRSITIFVPSFCGCLLSAKFVDVDSGTCPILEILCDIVKEHANIPSEGEASGSQGQPLQKDIAIAVLGLLYAIGWTAPYEEASKLSIVPLTDGVLLTLMDSRQAAEVVTRAMELLVVFANYETLFRSFLSVPESRTGGDPPPQKDYTRIPLVERICSYLADPSLLQDNEDVVLPAILNFFFLILYAHADSLIILQQSYSLIPSLISYLSHATNLLWDDYDVLMNSTEATTSTIKTMNQALFLLYNLVFFEESAFSLELKILHASPVHFNGLSHLFVVTMGRLSYADLPDWLTAEQKTNMEQLTEPARDLLELVVKGPEVDSIWAAYQDDDSDEEGPSHEGDANAMQVDPI